MTRLYTYYGKIGRFRSWLAERSGESLGSWGEWTALGCFRRKGWELVARNWSTRSGEIDLIFYDREVLVFVEVKTRMESGLYPAEKNFSPRKLEKMEALAWNFLERFELGGTPVRFDLAAVETHDRREFRLRHYQGLGD